MAYVNQAEKDATHADLRAAQATPDAARITAAEKVLADKNARPLNAQFPVAN